MAFTGTPVVEQISDSMCRVTGVSLGAGASGTIGLHARTASPAAGVTLPAGFKPGPYKYDSVAVGLTSAIDVSVRPNTTGGITVAVPVNSAKTGDTPQDFLATFTNPSGGATNGLEIYVKFHE